MTRKFNSFFDFLRKTPKNLTSIIVIWCMSLLLMQGVYSARYEMHAGWQIFSYTFLLLIMFLGFLRVWLIYKKF